MTSTNFSLEAIREAIIKRTREKLAEGFREEFISYHTRKGIRRWCECSFCNTKRQGTWDISWGPWSRLRYEDRIAFEAGGADIEDIVKFNRKKRIEQLREELEREKK
jgi:hypothetical protein